MTLCAPGRQDARRRLRSLPFTGRHPEAGDRFFLIQPIEALDGGRA